MSDTQILWPRMQARPWQTCGVSRDTVQEAVVNHKCGPYLQTCRLRGEYAGTGMPATLAYNTSESRSALFGHQTVPSSVLTLGFGEELGVMQRLEHAGELHQLRPRQRRLLCRHRILRGGGGEEEVGPKPRLSTRVGSWLSGEANRIGAPTNFLSLDDGKMRVAKLHVVSSLSHDDGYTVQYYSPLPCARRSTSSIVSTGAPRRGGNTGTPRSKRTSALAIRRSASSCSTSRPASSFAMARWIRAPNASFSMASSIVASAGSSRLAHRLGQGVRACVHVALGRGDAGVPGEQLQLVNRNVLARLRATLESRASERGVWLGSRAWIVTARRQ
jgi:hypothetical protein